MVENGRQNDDGAPWQTTCLNSNAFTDMNDPCYQKSPAQIFQISQFWYNAIKYAASTVACFDIRGPGILR